MDAPFHLLRIESHSARVRGARLLAFSIDFGSGFNSRLVRRLLQEEPRQLANHQYNVFTWKSVELARLRLAVRKCFRIYEELYDLREAKRSDHQLKGIIRVVRKGQRVGVHDHVDTADATGVYYAQTTAMNRAVETVFLSKFRGRVRKYPLSPPTGTLVLYQSDLRHYSPPYPDSRAKVVVAFDLTRSNRAGLNYMQL